MLDRTINIASPMSSLCIKKCFIYMYVLLSYLFRVYLAVPVYLEVHPHSLAHPHAPN